MQDFCKFLVDYWKPLFGIFMCLVSIIITIFRKRPSASSVLDYIYRIVSDNMPSYISQAEKKFEAGEDKLLYVVGCCMEDLNHVVQLDSNAKDKARFCFIQACESILETPQKKD